MQKTKPLLYMMLLLLLSMAVYAETTGIAYSPFRDGQAPWGPCPTNAQIKEDLKLLKALPEFDNWIRTYGVCGPCNLKRVINLANGLNIRSIPGAWIDTNQQNSQCEVDTAIALANTKWSVKGVTVGNEVLLRNTDDDPRNDVPKQDLINYIRQVQSKVSKPVSSAEPCHIWLDDADKDVVQELDALLVNVYGYHAGLPVEQSAQFALDCLAQVKAKYPGKKVFLGETGWPTAGEVNGQAVPSVANQKRFIQDLLAKVQGTTTTLFYFEGFDEAWKCINNKQVECHWGLFTSNRQRK